MSKEFIHKLAQIQLKLNAPKNQRNSFGNYNYRSCEDILEGVKPLLGDLFLSISDEIVQIGDRFYVKATATITDGESSHSASAMARESLTKKGMDDAQITGATSSYARKYCLNGLFGIDDAKDADTDEHTKQVSAPDKKSGSNKPSPTQILYAFTDAASKKVSVPELQEAFGKAWKMLEGTEEQSKAKDIYEIRKNELELPA
ncbi:ERF family protein [Serratia proteamaculans]|uniref:ERF family protein n=1 Tax=Serratia proteamaculans TaxID=28151 RepID=UPI00217C9EB7|nr:ERF family protein [Serratia proteamaculans]CAI1179488.1 ERF superfamily [Serratia proteamaculans]